MEQAKTTETSNAQTAMELLKKYGTWSAAIRDLFAQGKSKGEIAKLLGKSYQHVYNVLAQAAKKAEVKTTSTASEGSSPKAREPDGQPAKGKGK